MEEELAKHLKQLADQFHGLAPVKCRELAFEYAEKNNIPVPANWTETQCADSESEFEEEDEMTISQLQEKPVISQQVDKYGPGPTRIVSQQTSSAAERQASCHQDSMGQVGAPPQPIFQPWA
ncbi:unnamed protein product [Pleuronectes platessa]|uniref:Uncharacterized protein n=1 Tax=Pleuronectes platessa TaxID=8262 RepID=A0A9N7TXX9_PLEPL|nr:unnamed protein product [Pleuronectes platessa]